VRRGTRAAGTPGAAEGPAAGPSGAATGGVAGGVAGAADRADRPGGRLYVVATPIGNLGDVTLRALEVLRAVPLVAAEDTRMTRRLFARHQVTTHLVSYHARNAVARSPELLARLRAGDDLALVTDAGTPLVSDPGGELVAAWAAEGGAVVPIPGPSAVLAALVASGVAGPRWAFEGFLPRSGRERRERLARVAADPRTTVLFEAPGRLGATLADLVRACGAGRAAAVCRELTKIHEEVRRGSLAELAAAVAAGDLAARGEIVIVVGDAASAGGADAGAAARGEAVGVSGPGAGAHDDETLARARAEVERLVADGTARGDAARRVAATTGIGRRRLYGAAPDR
jgi:16S rRNA (cytidine1402-2'-O)-methyltransferase